MILAASSVLVQFSETSKKLTDKVEKDLDLSKASQNFVQVMESASIAMRYQHLPVRVGTACAAGKPCVRQINPTTKDFVALDGNNLGINPIPETIEFFRDHHGGAFGANLPTTPALSGNPTLRIQGTTPIFFKDPVPQREYYTTWPLEDENSPPFVLLRTFPNAEEVFSFNNRFLTATPPPGSGRYVFLFGSKPGIDVTKYEGTLALVVNLNNGEHYFFQLINTAIDCNQGTGNPKQACLDRATPYESLASWSYGSFATDPDLRAELNQQYMFELVTVENAPRFQQRYVVNSLNMGFTPSSWSNQTASFYLFATTIFSMMDPADPHFDPRPVDLRKIATYMYSDPGLIPKFAVVPIAATAYYLDYDAAKDTTALKTSTFNNKSGLIGTRLGDPEYTVVDSITGKVVFGRKLGTSDVKMFIFP